MTQKLTFIFSLFFVCVGMSQSGNPTDYLTPEFHKERREALRKKMPSNSVAVFFANPIRNRANDVDYIFHQDPNFYYLTGYSETNSVLVIFSENQTSKTGETYNEILYVQGKNARLELYNGQRLGVDGAKNKLGFKTAFLIAYKEGEKISIEEALK